MHENHYFIPNSKQNENKEIEKPNLSLLNPEISLLQDNAVTIVNEEEANERR